MKPDRTAQANTDILDLTVKELENLLESRGFERYRARQIFHWIYRRGITSPDRFLNLPPTLRDFIRDGFSIAATGLAATLTSSLDGTCKFVFRLRDGSVVESVAIPSGEGSTYCLSTQTGCSFGCTFCATSKLGRGRNLTPGEIVGQLLGMRKETAEGPERFNVVFMGMGEPLQNYDSTIRAIRIMMAEEGFCISPRRVTVSTCGIVPGILKLAREKLRVGLSVSLNAATDSLRERLMRVNRKYPLEQLVSALKVYTGETKRKVTLEYVLIRDVNDSIEDAMRLRSLADSLQCKINVILYNTNSFTTFEPPGELEVDRFLKVLLTSRRAVTLRRSKGADIGAACGQLGSSYQKGRP
ncbi:MAG: 23S rRNA (adenine(2503)-C(2))-methyltransferase RlmN [Candidatus Eisenbacteria bacterium]|nr:23S rRNA (adenine(2503)-C(2))-methyltransferase RlmN [Candidatus Eisenbacteria bacterium]